MLFSLLQKRKDIRSQKKIIGEMIQNLHVSEDQKKLYQEALDIVPEEKLDELYNKLIKFIERMEIKTIEDIKKESFGRVAGMRKKEASEKIEEMNSFSLLLHNL